MVAKSHKKADYLDALADPSLPDDRRLALRLMFMVRIEQAGGDWPSPLGDVAAEQARQKSALECANCGEPTQGAALFCGDYCQQLTQTIRYVRKATLDQRIEKPDIQEGVGIRLWMLINGGYPRRERNLSELQRQSVMERDSRVCQLCGNPAEQIDHISNSSSTPTNLQALCAECNRKKAFANTRAATDEEAEEIYSMLSDMAQRIAAPMPVFLCDDHEQWRKCFAGIVGARRRLSRLLSEQQVEEDDDGDFEDVDGYLHESMQKSD